MDRSRLCLESSSDDLWAAGSEQSAITGSALAYPSGCNGRVSAGLVKGFGPPGIVRALHSRSASCSAVWASWA